MGKPKSLGTPLAMSSQWSPPSSLRYRPQWFWRYRRSGRPPAGATLCTHWPNSGYLSGRNTARMPSLRACQLRPPSSVRYTPPVEMAIHIRSGSAGSGRTVCRHSPPPPGSQRGRWGWSHSPSTSSNVSPPSSERNSAAGSTPAHTVPGRSSPAGCSCHTRASAASRPLREPEVALGRLASSSAPGRPSTAPPPPSARARSRPAAGAARPARRTGWRTPARPGSAARSSATSPAPGRPRTARPPSWSRPSAGCPRTARRDARSCSKPTSPP